jgi:acyl-CoA synthetase (AMP-forming)/AMP-acid ligase II
MDTNIQTLESSAVADTSSNLGYFFRDQAHAASERVAVVDLWGGLERTLSFRALDARMDRAGRLLQTLGLKPGDRVALILGNRGEYLEAFFGAMRAGVVPVPLNPKQSRQTLELMVRDAGCIGAIVDSEAAPDAAGLIDELGLRTKVMLGQPTPGWIAYEADVAGSDLVPAISPDGIAFQPYTAGSTGRPKGVRLTHKGMLWSVRSSQQYWPMAQTEVGLVAVPLFHKNAMRGTVKPALYAGAKFVIMPRFDARLFLEALAKYRVTFSGGVPAIFSMLLKERDLIAGLDYSALKMFSLGSAVVAPEMIDTLERVFPGVKVKESYGLTEAGGPLRSPSDKPTPRGSCGIIARDYEVKLVDSGGTEGVSEGELWTRSLCVTDGYHNLPSVTKEKIVDGWLRTGDVFKVDANGYFYFLGRTDDMFSCGGENVYPKEVENILFSHPAVSDACVVAIPHQVKGFVPAAAVVLTGNATATPEELKAFCLANGPAYSHPRRIMVVEELPLSGAGKPDRKLLQKQLAANN